MQDQGIIALFWERDERAIAETERAYGPYCYTIARNILRVHEDAEECVNDTFLAAWNAIPPERPACLRAFLGKLTRNISLSRYRANTAAKRGGDQVTVALSELEGCVAGEGDVVQEMILRQLAEAMDRFLQKLSPRDCDLFLARYYFFYSPEEIAQRAGMKQDYVRTVLARTRQKLRAYLEKENHL